MHTSTHHFRGDFQAHLYLPEKILYSNYIHIHFQVAVLLMDSSEALNLGKCPPQPLESLVAEYFRCHPLRRYHCLFDSLRKIYSIHCFSALKQPAGTI